MAVNAVLRAFAGYILFLLAFLLRSLEFGPPGHPVSHNFALGVLAVGLTTGSLASMLLGSFFRGRAPHLIMFSVLAIAPVITIVCAVTFGLWAAAVVEFTAIFCASLAKLGQDSIVQREIGDEIRSSTFAVSETLNQVANVAGGLAVRAGVHAGQRAGGPRHRRGGPRCGALPAPRQATPARPRRGSRHASR